jgi:hypothetical protein
MRGRLVAATAVAAAVAIAGCGDSNDEAEPVAAVTCPAATQNPSNPFDANTLVGMTVDEASGIAQQHDCSVRVTERDGEPLPATMDLQNNRIDVIVVDGKITAVSLS